MLCGDVVERGGDSAVGEDSSTEITVTERAPLFGRKSAGLINL